MGNEPSLRVGVLGGGQLSRMLCEAAGRLGIEVIPFCFSADDPAAQISRNFRVGQLSDEAALKEYFSQVDLVTYENDFLPYETLKHFSSVKFIPALHCLENVRDKIQQKQIFQKLGIQTPSFQRFEGGDLSEWIARTAIDWSGEVVFKWAREGYDGKGVHLFSGDLQAAGEFCEAALRRSVQIFAERRVRFRRELALVSVYSRLGEMVFYPLVISEQANGICKRVTGPAKALGVDPGLEVVAKDWARRVAECLEIFGTFALEFFEDDRGELWVNELAPRVHNSGHFSMNASEVSQFENHLRGICGLPLGCTASSGAFGMLNLLGPSGRPSGDISCQAAPQNFFFHWYGKKESREGRKMGHINFVCSSPKHLESSLRSLEVLERDWLSKFSIER